VKLCFFSEHLSVTAITLSYTEEAQRNTEKKYFRFLEYFADLKISYTQFINCIFGTAIYSANNKKQLQITNIPFRASTLENPKFDLKLQAKTIEAESFEF